MTEINSLSGPLGVHELGVTLMHEHVMSAFPGWESDTSKPRFSKKEMMAIGIDRIQQMQDRGIRSMVDPCPNDLGRDVVFSAELAAKTGFNIICATGLYKEDLGGAAYWKIRAYFGSLHEQMAELFIRELTVGIGSTDIKAGIIKIGTGTGEITDYERSVILAAATASLETGAPVTTHTDGGELGDEQQRLLISHGVAPHKIIIGHSCTSANHDYHMHILTNGSYLGFDRFGINFEQTDEVRIESLKAILNKGFEQRMILSHDSCWCYHGEPIPQALFNAQDGTFVNSPTHIHDKILPALLEAGISQTVIDTMLVANPRRYFLAESR